MTAMKSAIHVIIATVCFSFFVSSGKCKKLAKMGKNSQYNIAAQNCKYLSEHGLLTSDSAGQDLGPFQTPLHSCASSIVFEGHRDIRSMRTEKAEDRRSMCTHKNNLVYTENSRLKSSGDLRPVYTGDFCGDLSGDFCCDIWGDSKSPV